MGASEIQGEPLSYNSSVIIPIRIHTGFTSGGHISFEGGQLTGKFGVDHEGKEMRDGSSKLSTFPKGIRTFTKYGVYLWPSHIHTIQRSPPRKSAVSGSFLRDAIETLPVGLLQEFAFSVVLYTIHEGGMILTFAKHRHMYVQCFTAEGFSNFMGNMFQTPNTKNKTNKCKLQVPKLFTGPCNASWGACIMSDVTALIVYNTPPSRTVVDKLWRVPLRTSSANSRVDQSHSFVRKVVLLL